MTKKSLLNPPAWVFEKIERDKERAKASARARKKRQYYANPDKFRQRSAENRMKFSKNMKLAKAKYYTANKGVLRAKIAEYRQANPEKAKSWARKQRSEHGAELAARARSRATNLDDSYLKGVIRANYGIPASQVPPELIELKRTIIKAKRELKREST